MKPNTKAAISAVGQSMVQVFLLVVVMAVPVAPSQVPPTNDKHKSVLLLFSEDSNIPAQVVMEQSVRSTLKNGSAVPLDMYSEYLDYMRTPVDDYEKELVGLLRRKYEGRKFDLIVAVLPTALRVLLKNRADIFPDTPIVFLVFDQRNVADLPPGSNVTGVWGEISFKPNMDLALTLHPNTKKAVVLAGVSDYDKYWTAQVQKDFQAYEGRLEISYLIGLTNEEYQKALAGLPQHTLAFLVSISRDHAGNSQASLDVLRQISPVSSAPIYGFTDAQLGLGIVGGSVVSFEALGREAGRIGLRILAAETPQSIAPRGIPNIVMFDWRELQRWGIDENKLPAGSIVRYRQPSVWELYKWHIAGVVGLCILEAAFIVLLLVSRYRRRQAERANERLAALADAKQRRLEEIIANTPGIVWESIIDAKTGERKLTFISDYAEKMLGYSVDEWYTTTPDLGFTIIVAEDRELVAREINSVVNDGQPKSVEFRWLAKDGTLRWVELTILPICDAAGKRIGFRGVNIDITDRKHTEEALRQSEAQFRHMADTAPVLIWISDANMLCTYFNQRVVDFTGRSMEQLNGEGWLDSVHEDDVHRCTDAYTAGYERKEPFVMEYRLRRADGEFRWLYDTASPRFASNGEFLGYIGSAVDITDRRNAEEALQIAHEEVNKLKNQLEAENIYLQEEIRRTHNVGEIVGESNAIKYVLFKIEQVAQTDTSVLILGETGTGKELVARAIHSQSTRKDRPLVKVNCAALSASLIESELFGHEKGSFTGASARKIGRFELADGATIFLDEIGELPLELQPKLLRVIQEGEIERLGSSKTIKVDVRLIAATNRNLKDEVEKGNFREDLWYRLNVFPITLPPLRQRKDDIPLMVEHFARVFSKKVGKSITSISSNTMKKFQEHSWPGNVRELSNVVERALVTASGTTLHVADQFEQPKETPELDRTLEEIEKDHITRILEQTAWRVEGPSGAARILGLNPSTLRTRMGKLGIQKSIRSLAQASKQQN